MPWRGNSKFAGTIQVISQMRWCWDRFEMKGHFQSKTRGEKEQKFENVYWISALVSGEGNGNPLQYSCWEIQWTEEFGRL